MNFIVFFFISFRLVHVDLNDDVLRVQSNVNHQQNPLKNQKAKDRKQATPELNWVNVIKNTYKPH